MKIQDEDDDGRPIDSKALQDDSDKEKEEEASQAALIIYELYGAKHEMKTELEEKEAKFKREIRRAWEQPRPPPTTREQKADRLALAKLESKDIFDEFGEQQRPVHTDPRMVLLETTVNTMITRARLNYALGDYPQMYTQANHAAAAAGPLKFPPLTARCFYYRGMASYHYRAFSMAKDDFLDSRGCAGLYGISSESINYYTEKIDQAHDPETVIIEPFRPRGNSGVGKNERTTSTRSTNVDSENEPSPSALGSAATLVGSSPTSPGDMALPMSPFSSPNKKERSAAQSREEASSQSQPPREPDILGGFPVDGEPQPKFDDVPNYQPQEQAISEEIRKDIFESKAQSLNPASEVISKEANSEETRALSPPSMASTEWTLLGSATSQGTARRVPRPHVPPITTAFAKLLIRQASLDAVLHSNSTDEMDEDERMAVFGEARENATPVSGSTDEMDEDEIMREFGAAKSGYIGAQGDDFTPVEDQTRGWGRH